MRLIDADKGLISKIQRETGCNFITAQKIVDSMPTVEERKVGKWLSAEEYAIKLGEEVTETIKNSLYKFCPFCEQTVFMERNYCPNCGSQMSDIPIGSD